MKHFQPFVFLFCLATAFQPVAFGQFNQLEYADSAQLLLVFENEQDTAAIHQLKQELQAVASGVTPLTRVYRWLIPLETIVAYGGPTGVQNHAVGKAVVKGGDINYATRIISPIDDDDDGNNGEPCYPEENFVCTPGEHPVLIAFTDTGLDGFATGDQAIWQHHHPEFDDRLWQNPGEENTALQSDDDSNGFIDDVKGWDFYQHDPLPQDEHAHGTHTAGKTAAILESNDDAAGKLLILQTQDPTGQGSLWSLVNALDYAFLNHTRIVNMSLAYLSPVNPFNKPSVLEYLMDFGKIYAGTLFIAAAGNDSLNLDMPLTLSDGTPVRYQPANQLNDNLIVVAAGDCANELAYFSNYGPQSVDLAAPGLNIYSAVLSGNYDYFSGTSMAAPHVTAAAALAGSQVQYFHWKGVKSDLLHLSLEVPGLTGLTTSGSMLAFCSQYSGNSALEVAIKANQVLCIGGSATLTARPYGGQSPYSYQWSNGSQTAQTNISAAGSYTVTLTDDLGITATETVVINGYAPPFLFIEQDSMQCDENSAVLIIAHPTPGADYAWSNGLTGAVIEVSPAQSTLYSVTATLPSGCSNTATVEVPVGELAVSIPEISVCQGGCAELIPAVSGAEGPFEYLWNTGESTPTIVKCPVSSKTYRVTVTSSEGCTGTATGSVLVRPKPTIAAIPNQTICPCASAVLNGNASGGTPPYSYLWQPGNATTPSITVSPASTTIYTLTVQDAQGCTASRSAKVSLKCRPPGIVATEVDLEQQTALFTWQPVCTSTGWQLRWRCGSNTWNNVNIANPLQLSYEVSLPANCTNPIWQIRGRCCNNAWSSWSQLTSFQEGAETRTTTSSTHVQPIIQPNPAEDRIWINWPVASPGARGTIFSAAGTKVQAFYLEAGDVHEINIGKLPAGSYWLTLGDHPAQAIEMFVKL